MDLESLGLVLIQAMSGSSSAVSLDIDSVREQRRVNKLYGVRDAEPWSHCNSLIDFLDELFNEDKPAAFKFEKKVSSHVN
jgi:hypothetical protein